MDGYCEAEKEVFALNNECKVGRWGGRAINHSVPGEHLHAISLTVHVYVTPRGLEQTTTN